LTLKSALRSRPIIYEVVPPRRDASRFSTELRGVEGVLAEPRVAAVNIPELVNRREGKGGVSYSPATIPPEEYALLLRGRKEAIVDIIAPRLPRDQFVARAKRVLLDYGVPNLILVGKERSGDQLPGPGVVEAAGLVRGVAGEGAAIGGICIFDRPSEAERVAAKARGGCDFVASQIVFDAGPALRFLEAYSALCESSGSEPVTVFLSLAPVPTASILSLLETLDVSVPPAVRGRLLGSGDMGRESLAVEEEVLRGVVSGAEERAPGVPLGVQVEQVGVNSDRLGLELVDRADSTVH
jgi:5,10-methylenetetrahydrofolate reductase